MYIAPSSSAEQNGRCGPAEGAEVHDQGPDIRAQALFDQLDTVYRMTHETLYGSLVVGVLIAMLLWDQVAHAMVWAWLVPKTVLPLVRMHGVHRFKRDLRARERVRYWTGEYLGLMLVDTMIWAALPVVFMPYCDANTDMLLFGAELGVAGAGAYITWNHLAIGVCSVVPVLGTLIADQVLNYGKPGLISATAIFVYMVILLVNVKRGEARGMEILRLRYENAWIAEQRSRALAHAEHASAAKTRFLAAVSHEIRTPLNGIFGMTQILLGTVTGEQQRRQLQLVERSARYLRTVVGDLLDMSRIEFGKLVVEREPFDVVDTVREVTDLLACVAAEKGLAFDVRFAPGVPASAIGDASRIKQVLHNLIGNAVKFTRSDGGRGAVTVTVAPADFPGGLRFTVGDNGEGVRADQIEQIFQAFEQVGSDDAARRAGTGLGLTISRQLARAMGGDVSCVSRPGEGAEFTLCVMAPNAPQGSHHTPEVVAAPARPRLSGCVLLVDDNPVNALVASSMMELLGLRVERAEDGEEALQRLAAGTYDVVLMDCLMPGIDGLETTRRWRIAELHAGRPRVPVVALTASAIAGDRERCLAAGMDDHLTKPFEQSELVALLERHLRGAASPAGGPAQTQHPQRVGSAAVAA